MLFFTYWLLRTRRGKLEGIFMTVVMYPLQQHGQRGQRVDTRGPERRSCLADVEIKYRRHTDPNGGYDQNEATKLL